MAEPINIPIITSYDDKGAKEATSDLEALEKTEVDVPITITADDQASPEIADVKGDAEALDKADAEIVLTAKVDAAKADLASLQAELKATGERAEDTERQLDRTTGGGGGPSVRGNAIADLTGPLGEASGAASDFAGVFDGLGDIAEAAASKMGASASSAAALSGIVGGLGIAVAAGAAAWSLFSQRQAKAREDQKKLIEGQREWIEALKAGDRTLAALKFKETYQEAFDAASRAGIPFNEVYDVITGTAEASETLTQKQKDVNQAFEDGRAGQERYNNQLVQVNSTVVKAGDEMTKAKNDFAATSEAIVTQDGDLADLEGAMYSATGQTKSLGKASRETRSDVDMLSDGLDAIRGKLDFEQAALNFSTNFQEAMAKAQGGTALTQQEILDLKSDYLAVAGEIGKTPVEIRADLKKIEAGEIGEVLFDTQQKINSKPPMTIKAKLQLEKTAIVVTGAGGGNQNISVSTDSFVPGGTLETAPAAPAPAMMSAAAAPMVVNINMPKGSRGVDVLRQVTSQARRSGRRYGTPVVHYARQP